MTSYDRLKDIISFGNFKLWIEETQSIASIKTKNCYYNIVE